MSEHAKMQRETSSPSVKDSSRGSLPMPLTRCSWKSRVEVTSCVRGRFRSLSGP
ncbi:unnamed protein product, partial [Symbiodinium sp. CCMP2456]